MPPDWPLKELIVGIFTITAAPIALHAAKDRLRQGRALSAAREALAAERDSNVTLESRVAERTAELERRSEQLTLANRELEAFAYSVSHDLRAPLRAVSGFSQAILEDHGHALPAEVRTDLERVIRAAGHMSEIIDAMLGLARVGRGGLDVGPVDLSWLVRGIFSDLMAQHADRKVVLSVTPGLFANTDKRLVGVVLSNLLSNAVKFTRQRDPACISVGVTEQDGQRAFFVRDNGAGFDQAYVARLFHPFQRLHSADQFEGIGIGLATAQRAIQHLGGRIWATSAVGEGATFMFTLGDSGAGASS